MIDHKKGCSLMAAPFAAIEFFTGMAPYQDGASEPHR